MSKSGRKSILATPLDFPSIWFDHQIFSIQQYGGVSRYFYELARALTAQAEMNVRIFAPAHVNGYLRKGDMAELMGFYKPYPKRGLRFRPKFLAPLLRLALEIYKPQILHETYYGLDGLHVGRAQKIVTTVHDMIFEKFPDMLDRNPMRVAMKYRAMKRADQIICISQNTRTDLLEFYPEFADKTTVVYHGATFVAPLKTEAVDFPEPFILYVGTRTHYKNYERLVKAIGGSVFLRENFGLVLFGGGELTAEELSMMRNAGIPERRVVQISGSDELLSLAYNRAAAFVFPSIYEGFGMPLTEAMLHGCPIVCSRASCFPEICGEAAEYFDPHDTDAMRSALEGVLGSVEKREHLSKASRHRSGFFSWQKCAEETSRIYRKIL